MNNVWISLDEFKEGGLFLGKTIEAKGVPRRWSSIFEDVDDMYTQIMNYIQRVVNSYFNDFFITIEYRMLNDWMKLKIKWAIFSMFTSIYMGTLPWFENVINTLSTSGGFSFETSYVNDPSNFGSMFTADALKMFDQTGINKAMILKHNDPKAALELIGSWNRDLLVTQEEFAAWIEAFNEQYLLQLEFMMKTIEDGLADIKENILTDEEFVNNLTQQVDINYGSRVTNLETRTINLETKTTTLETNVTNLTDSKQDKLNFSDTAILEFDNGNTLDVKFVLSDTTLKK